MLRAGELRHRVDLHSNTGATRNAFGEKPESWAAVATSLPAKVEPLTGRELWSSQQIQPDISHKVTIRYLAGLNAKMRVIFGTRTFNVEGPPKNIEERNIMLELMCREVP